MTTSPLPRVLPVSAWPDLDRQLWEAAQESPYVIGLSATALAAIAEGYGRWISVLTAQGALDPAQRPADRVKLERVHAYIAELRQQGNTHKTIVARLCHLGSALRIIEPQRSFTWLHPRRLLGAPAKTRKDPWHDWPAIDQHLWEAGLQVGDLLDDANHAARLRPATIHSAAVGYRRWLVFLRDEGRLDPDIAPAARVTRAVVGRYFKCLRESHCNASVIARLTELRTTLLIMHPDADFSWLTSPRGRSLSALLPVSPKPIQSIDTKVLYEHGWSMMEAALAETNPERRRVMYRDGLLVALFASRAPRVLSMTSLRIGQTIIRLGNTYRILFEHEDIKTGRRLEYDTPPRLSSAIDHYIAVERAELMGEQHHDWFWVDQYGDKLSASCIGDMIRRTSTKTFDVPFGPHRFRHALGTTAPLVDPAHPGIAAAILGISTHMVEMHYNRATQADVANTFHRGFANTREKHRLQAQQEFEASLRSGSPVAISNRKTGGEGGGRGYGKAAGKS